MSQHKGTIFHITPFIWTMGYRKGIFGVEAYKLTRRYGFFEYFLAPNVNIFGPKNVYNQKHLENVGIRGKIFKNDYRFLRPAQGATRRLGLSSNIGKIIWFLSFMGLSFIESFIIISRIKDVKYIYAHTWLAVPQSYILSKIFRVPIIYRIYGIHNYVAALKDKTYNNFLKPDLLVFTIPCDAYVITNDGTLGKAVALRMGIPESKILFLLAGYPGVPEDNLKKENDREELFKKFKVKDNTKLIFYAGRLIIWKGIERLIRVIYYIKKKKPKLDVKLVIAGDGDKKEYFRGLTKDLNLENDVIFLGSIPSERVGDYLTHCDLFLSLQDLSNVTNTLIEAMKNGACVVVGDVGGTKDIIHNNKNGVLVPRNNYEKIGYTIINLLDDDKERIRLGMSAKEYAKDNFVTWERRIKMELDWVVTTLSTK